MGTTPIAWNIPKTDTSSVNINLGGYKPSVGSEVVGSLASIGTMLTMGILSNAIQGKGKQTPAQQGSSEAMNIARSMDAAGIQGKIESITSEITSTETKIQDAANRALGKDSNEYKESQTAAKDLENKYGFGSGDVSKGDETQKNGRDYQTALNAYNTLSSKKANYDAAHTRITAAQTTNENSLNSVNKQINELKEVPNPGDGSNGEDAKTYQKKLVEFQNYQNQKVALENQQKQLQAEQIKLKKENDDNENEKNKVSDKDLQIAKATLDKSKSGNGNDYEAQYKIYNSLIDKCQKIELGAGKAKTEANALNNQLNVLNKQLATFQEAAKLKDNITNDDKASAGSFKGADNHDGNFFSRMFNKSQRYFHNIKETDIKTYMQDHGVSRKEAEKALEGIDAGKQKSNTPAQAVKTVATTPPADNNITPFALNISTAWGSNSSGEAEDKAKSFIDSLPLIYQLDTTQVTDYFTQYPDATNDMAKKHFNIT